MEQYIPKDALVAEIERRLDDYKDEYKRSGDIYASVLREEMEDILSFLDTLEVKEVDISKEISQFIDDNFEKATIGHKLSLRRVAKHFFELGMAVSNKAQKGE